jgi:glutamine amidotransferase
MSGLSGGVWTTGWVTLRSVEKAFQRAGAKAFVSDDPKRLTSADFLVVPGVGAFDAAMTVLRQKS